MGTTVGDSESLDSTKLRALWVDALLLVVAAGLFAATASWAVPEQTRDALGANLAAWNLVENGSLDLSQYDRFDAWIIDSSTGSFTNRTPGIIATATLGYLFASPVVEDFVAWPGTLMAVLTAAASVIVGRRILLHLGVGPPLSAVLALGLGTSMWGIGSDQILPHAPASLFVVSGLLFALKQKPWLAGLLFSVALLIRPPTAMLAASVGVALGWSRRQLQPVVAIGVPTAVGLAGFLYYTQWMFGSWSLFGLYDAKGGLSRSPESISEWLQNIAIAFASPTHGVLIWSPWIIIGLVAVWKTRDTIPTWILVTPVAAIVYIVVHSGINRVTAGIPFNYRYQLEAVMFTGPVLLFAAKGWADTNAQKALIAVAIGAAVALQFVFLFLSGCTGLDTSTPQCSLFGVG